MVESVLGDSTPQQVKHFGRAMIAVSKHGAPKQVLESKDINELVTE